MGPVVVVRLPELDVVWKAQEDIRLTGIWTEAADLTTSTVVADQGLLLEVQNGVVTPVTVDDLR